ncbi:hypothetical protein OG298_00580 [Streptomyces sp. NBC_01005]|uniref:Uncharacterized protein n=1 Tax=Streptomyces sanglieri TaxID=193460 RepID=A0ABW2WRK3_9ACTN|nr:MULTISPECIES: hypothetical protein [unclassified Streptomyces]WSW02989.1 hypothetical protein OG298_00580 [Streptomyces sp. NBC_01005]WTB60227.1 hypothetical protein OG832_44865 [Streptomyces sp. NBC_00826]WTC92495.1 hypothetical protein OH736_00580 [Streptomyces sp. NBC_01650]MCX4902518.1 hypothetical protein [Streptomyces sp. NBC_00892]WTB60576.1 hypothetical protein OG832_47035 [Streptomyces sp. NBC_00826]
MAELVAREEVRVSVEFHAFALQEEDDMEVSAPFPEERVEGPGADLLTAYDKRLDFDSAGHTHEAALTAEVWSSEPSVAGDAGWEVQGEAEIFSTTGNLSVETMSGVGEGRVELGRPETLWKVRAFCSGRAEAARLASVGVPVGVERYLVQFWPAST